MSEVCVTFTLSRLEFEAGFHRMFWALWQCIALVVAGLVVLMAALVFALIAGWGTALGWFLLAVLWLGMAAWIYAVSPRRQYARRARLGHEQTPCFSDAGTTAHFSDVDSRLQWSAYTGVLETRDVYVLRIEKRGANMVPKRAFATSEEEARFRQLIRQHTKVKFRPDAVTA